MALETPTTKEIRDNLIAQIEAELGQVVSLLPKSFIQVMATAIAAVFIVLYKYGGSISLQTFVKHATIDDTLINGLVVSPLKEWGRLIGVGDPAAATNAILLVDVTVTNQTGTLPSGSQLINSTNGVTYLTTTSILLNAPTVQVNIEAVSDQTGGGGEGAIGNLDPGAIVTFANPLSNVARDTVVDSQTVTGADGEATEAYRQRVIDRFQKTPQGGALADYQLWAEEPAGIVNAFPYTSDCPGQVDVYIEATPESSGSADGIPTAAQLQEALDSIEFDDAGLASRRPANALANTFPIDRVGFDVRVLGINVPNLADTQAEITTAITEYFLAREPFIIGLSVLPRLDRITRSEVGGIVAQIVSGRGGVFGSAIVTLIGSPIEQFSLGIGEKAKAATVTFV